MRNVRYVRPKGRQEMREGKKGKKEKRGTILIYICNNFLISLLKWPTLNADNSAKNRPIQNLNTRQRRELKGLSTTELRFFVSRFVCEEIGLKREDNLC